MRFSPVKGAKIQKRHSTKYLQKWLLIPFGQWEAPARDRKQKKETGIFIPHIQPVVCNAVLLCLRPWDMVDGPSLEATAPTRFPSIISYNPHDNSHQVPITAPSHAPFEPRGLGWKRVPVIANPQVLSYLLVLLPLCPLLCKCSLY